MNEIQAKFIIVGAGLSGLTTAYQLLKAGEKDFLILESRETIGGRILTENGIDFGATWFQNHHHKVSDLLAELKIEKFHQFNKGQSVLVYSTMAPAHYFENDPQAPSAYRIAGNSIALIKSLSNHFKTQIKTEHKVTAISEQKDTLIVHTKSQLFRAKKVVVTVPPQLASKIKWSPALPANLLLAMEKTHTWMSNAIKVGLQFKSAFWKKKNFSGMLIGQVGAVTELYDHSNATHDHFALMGFVNEGLREYTAAERKERILSYIAKYLGEEVWQYISYEEKDWSQDPNTSLEAIKSIYMSPSYGNPLFKKAYMGNKLLFSGAETSDVYGGYMDGAINSGINATEQLLN